MDGKDCLGWIHMMLTKLTLQDPSRAHVPFKALNLTLCLKCCALILKECHPSCTRLQNLLDMLLVTLPHQLLNRTSQMAPAVTRHQVHSQVM